LAIAVGSRGRRSVSGFHLERVSALLLAIEHHFGEDLAGLPVDLEVILALVPVAVHHVIRDLDKQRGFIASTGSGLACASKRSDATSPHQCEMFARALRVQYRHIFRRELAAH